MVKWPLKKFKPNSKIGQKPYAQTDLLRLPVPK